MNLYRSRRSAEMATPPPAHCLFAEDRGTIVDAGLISTDNDCDKRFTQDRVKRLIDRGAAALVGIGVVVVGATAGAGATAYATSGGKPTSGGSMVYAVNQPWQTLDPAVSQYDVVGLIDRNIFDSLVVQTSPGKFAPWLAKSWTISPNGETYTFNLRSGVTFQDGTPFNAEAVQDTLNHITSPATQSLYVAQLGTYVSSTIISPMTIQLNLSAPYTPLLATLSSTNLGIQSPTELAKPVADYEPVGTGPFRYVSSTANSVVLSRTSTYNSPPSGAIHKGPAYLNTLTFDLISSDSTRYGALTSGQVQGIDDIPANDLKTLGRNSSYTVKTTDAPGLNYNIYLNTSDPILSDVRVRKALVESVDLSTLVDRIYFGEIQRAWSPLSPTTADYDPKLVNSIKYNQAAANKLLNEAGWTGRDSAGYRTKDGKELTVVWLQYTTENQRGVLAQGIQSEAKKVGINIELPNLSVAQLTQDVINNQYGMFDLSEENPSPAIMNDFFNSKETLTGGGNNLSNLDSPQVDQWLEGAVTTTSAQVEQTDYDDVQKYVVDNAAVLPGTISLISSAQSKEVQGLSFDVQTYPNFYDVWLKG